jgi:hypothetical protein
MLETEYYSELFRVFEALGSSLTRNEYPFKKFLAEYKSVAEIGLITAAFILPIIMADKEDIPDYDKGDISLDGFKDMSDDVMKKSKSADKIKRRFADVVQEMVDAGVI